jgi:hypothetical protein
MIWNLFLDVKNLYFLSMNSVVKLNTGSCHIFQMHKNMIGKNIFIERRQLIFEKKSIVICSWIIEQLKTIQKRTLSIWHMHCVRLILICILVHVIKHMECMLYISIYNFCVDFITFYDSNTGWCDELCIIIWRKEQL